LLNEIGIVFMVANLEDRKPWTIEGWRTDVRDRRVAEACASGTYVLIEGHRVPVDSIEEHQAAGAGLLGAGLEWRPIMADGKQTPNTVTAAEPHATCPCCIPKRLEVCVTVDRGHGGRETRLVRVPYDADRVVVRQLAVAEAHRLGYRNAVAF